MGSPRDRFPTEKSLRKVLEDLREVKRYLPDHKDKNAIVEGLLGAVVAEEVTRQTVTRRPMIVGGISDVDKDILMSRWSLLSEHYRGARHEQCLKTGVELLDDLTSEEARLVIREIRSYLAPTINWALEATVIQPSVKIPGGRIVFDAFRVKGTRVALWKFRSRIFRFAAEYILWFVAVSGMAHWILWVMFDETYLLRSAEGVGKTVQFVLLCSTTFLVWAFHKSRISRPAGDKTKLSGRLIALGVWALVAAGWSYWVLWVLFDAPDALLAIRPFAKMGQLLFLACGGGAAWLVSRTLRHGGNEA